MNKLVPSPYQAFLMACKAQNSLKNVALW